MSFEFDMEKGLQFLGLLQAQFGDDSDKVLTELTTQCKRQIAKEPFEVQRSITWLMLMNLEGFG
jgi:hypothetical protein